MSSSGLGQASNLERRKVNVVPCHLLIGAPAMFWLSQRDIVRASARKQTWRFSGGQSLAWHVPVQSGSVAMTRQRSATLKKPGTQHDESPSLRMAWG